MEKMMLVSPNLEDNINCHNNISGISCMACETIQPSIASISDNNVHLKDKLTYLAKIKVSNADVLCKDCANTLIISYHFKKRLISNYSKLKQSNANGDEDAAMPFENVAKHKKKKKVNNADTSVKEILMDPLAATAKFNRIFVCQKCHISLIGQKKRMSITKVCICNKRRVEKIKVYDCVNALFKCRYCSKVYKEYSVLIAHEKKHFIVKLTPLCAHSGNVPNGNQSNIANCSDDCKTSLRRRTSKSKDKLCNECGKILKSLHKHKCAVKKKASAKVFTCEVCEKTFLRYGTYWSHKKYSHSVEKSMLDCPFCDRVFNNSNTLREHTIRHHNNGVMPFVCKICSKGFPTSSKIKRHMTIHSWLKQYRCTKCQTSFSQSAKLKIHMKELHKMPKSLTEEIDKNLSIINNSLEAISIVENGKIKKGPPTAPTEKSQ